MKILELITDINGTLSHTKLSAVVANSVATLAFLYQTFANGLTPELLVAYVTVVGLQRFGSKYLDTLGKGTNEEIK